ncbi:MAG: radical SAM protein [Anaerolineales bacterium]|jgi:anaerobic magnesium-protoporphyrin IX monomethyl ester cyclase
MYQKIVLVKPPEYSSFNFGTFSLAVLASTVRDIADVRILDATNLCIGEAVEEIWAYKPDLIGITVMGLKSVKPVMDFIKHLRSKGNDRTPIIAGGHGATLKPTSLLNSGANAVVIGEGELTFEKIIKEGIQPGDAGIACLVKNKIVIGPPQKLIHPLDNLRLPAIDLMPPPPDGIYLMETSRGCPHACAFCETTRFFGKRWRPKSPQRVIGEIQRLVETCDAWIIHFADDNFTADVKRVLCICKALQRETTLPAFFMVSARGDDLISDPELLPAMAAARILRITVGVETLSKEMSSKVGKKISPETYRKAFQRMRDLGIFSIASFIIGLPGEDPSIRQRSVELAIQAGPDAAHFLPFLPLPGIPLATGFNHTDPLPKDIMDANEFTRAFFLHPTIRNRLNAALGKGVRGLLAKATLEKYTKRISQV